MVPTAGCTGGAGGADVVETTDVAMEYEQFDPRNVHVDAGETVTWTNADSYAHSVTSASDNWSKDTEVPAGEETTHTFEGDGMYDVYCRFHGSKDLSGMSMKVGVGDATSQMPLGGGGGGY
jgi:plastocyanin